ncbi:MAG: class I SAM-dependent methyltransferase [Gemmataceae bacterium]
MKPDPAPTRAELEDLVRLKHGDLAAAGWGVRRRWRAGYFTPDDHYEALVRRLVVPGSYWLDVGGGASVFPHNIPLARELASRCGLLVGVDPSDNIHTNPFVHERAQCRIEEYQTDHRFDLATLRMVAEHVFDPPRVVAALAGLLRPRGVAVVYTINRRAPVALATRLTPFSLHHPVKRLLWGGAEKDTFPIAYKMNSHRELKRLFQQAGFAEQLFLHLDDLATFSQIKPLNWLELQAWRALHALRLRYPENCLLAVYSSPLAASRSRCAFGV